MESAESTAITHHLKDQVEQSLGRLSPTESKVLRLRFGLEDDNPLTLKEIGDRMNLSRERIRQIEAQALNKLRKSSTAGALASYLS